MADVTLAGPEVDAETWMWLPDAFPTEFHQTVEDWVRETAAFIRGFVAPETADEQCTQIAEAVLAVGAGRDDSLARFWRVPADRATLSIVSVLAWHDAALEHPDAMEAIATVAVARSGSHSGLTVGRWMARRDGVILVVEVIATAESAPALMLSITLDVDRLFSALTVWS